MAWLRPIPLGLSLIGAHAFIIYASFAYFFPLAPRYAQRLADVRSFAPTMTAGLLYAGAVTLAFACCAAAYGGIRSGRLRTNLREIVLWSTLMGLPLLAVYPINANDVFRYYLRGSITAVHGGNPFVKAPAAYPDQPYRKLAGEWAGKTSPYGPLWEATTAATVKVSGADLLTSIVAFKFLGLACHLGATLLIYQLLAGFERRRRLARTVLWAWNPAAFLMFVVDAHNDALMIALLLLGWWLLSQRDRPFAGGAALALATAIKMSGALALPFVLVAEWQRRGPHREPLRRSLALALGFAVALPLAYAPFADAGLAPFVRVLDESQSGTSFSPLAVVRYLGNTIDGFSPHLRTWKRVAMALFAGGVGVLLYATWLGRAAVRGIADAFLLYFCAAGRFRIWYPLWAFPWAILDTGNTRWSHFRLAATFAFLWTSQVSVVLYGHLYVHVLERSRAAAHFLGVSWTFALPLVLAALALRQTARSTQARRRAFNDGAES